MADLFAAEEAPKPSPGPRANALRPKCLCIDLETSLDASPLIHKLAAWRPDTDEKAVFACTIAVRGRTHKVLAPLRADSM